MLQHNNSIISMQSNAMHHYQAFGLSIESEFEMFQLAQRASGSGADLRIVSGSVNPQGIDSDSQGNQHCQAFKGSLWLNIPDVARFLITDGKEIIVDVAPNADLQTVKLYLLGSGMGAILQQRGDLVLHGNAVRINDQAIIVVAGSGVGKSTLAAEFHRRGYSLLADDVCAINLDGLVQPSYPYVKLWQSAIEKLGFSTHELIRIRLQKDKFYYPLKETFQQTALPVGAIYVLNKAQEDGFVVRPLKGINKLRVLQRNKYRGAYAKKMKIAHEHITRIAQMLQKVEVTRIVRPENGFKLEALAQVIIDDFDKNHS